MNSKKLKTIGWIISGILVIIFGMSAFMKISLNESMVEQASAMGLEESTYQMIGLIELLSLVLFVIPRTGVVGALLLMAYMGGAIVVHIIFQYPLGLVLLFEVLIWVTAALRYPELAQRLFYGSDKKAAA